MPDGILPRLFILPFTLFHEIFVNFFSVTTEISWNRKKTASDRSNITPIDYFALCFTGNKMVLEQIVTTLASVADTAEEKFQAYYVNDNLKNQTVPNRILPRSIIIIIILPLFYRIGSYLVWSTLFKMLIHPNYVYYVEKL